MILSGMCTTLYRWLLLAFYHNSLYWDLYYNLIWISQLQNAGTYPLKPSPS